MTTAAPANTHAETASQVTFPTIVSGASVVRHLSTKHRVARILELPLECMHNTEFDQPRAEQTILAATPSLAPMYKPHRLPSGLPPYLAALYETPLPHYTNLRSNLRECFTHN